MSRMVLERETVSNLINRTTLDGDKEVVVEEGLLCTAKNADFEQDSPFSVHQNTITSLQPL